MQHLVLIDGHHLLHRAYWAIPRTLRTRKGEQTNVSFGVASMILSILKEEEPDALLFCFDEGAETFRHQEAEDYKAGRAETPQEFYDQIPRVMELLKVFSFQHVSHPRYEADDLLCSYARAARNKGMRVTIVSGDRDILQLAEEHVRIAAPKKAGKMEYMGPEDIKKRYGVYPNQVPSYKGLCGDPSDNLPGVHGVGPKTAAKLLQKFGDLETLYSHLADLQPHMRSTLEREQKEAFFCKRMAELICDIPLAVSLDALHLHDISCSTVIHFFRELEFTILERRLLELARTPHGRRIFTEDVAQMKKDEEQMRLFS